MKLALILTNDWELFGDGSGDYFEIQQKPLEALLTTVEAHGARLTVMAEVGQQWAHQRIGKEFEWASKVVKCWEDILQETIKRGSDVQLHLHPQWLNAKHRGDKWDLDYSQWAIPSLGPVTMENVLKEGKQYLDSILQPVNPQYECLAFRAGAYCIQPSKSVIEGLVNAGIICDTSVTKGMYNPQYFDYRDAHSNILPWFVSPDDVRYRDEIEGRLLEIPIYSCESIDSAICRRVLGTTLVYKLLFGVWLNKSEQRWLSERDKKERERYPSWNRPLSQRNIASIRWWLSKLIVRGSIQLDYDVLPPRVFTKCVQKILEDKTIREYYDKDVIIPVVASGHVKRMHNCENIERILTEMRSTMKEKVIYWTLTDAIRYWMKERPTWVERNGLQQNITRE